MKPQIILEMRMKEIQAAAPACKKVKLVEMIEERHIQVTTVEF